MKKNWYLHWLFGGAILAGLSVCSFLNYLLFHTLVELFTIIIAFSIFTISWSSRSFHESPIFLWLGISFFAVGMLDFLHTITYKGMGVFPNLGANTPTQLWIAARYVQSISFLAIGLRSGKQIHYRWLSAAYMLVVSALILSIFVVKIFPVCYVEGTGLTPFKIYSEYIISLIFLAAIAIFYRQKSTYNHTVLNGIILSIIVTILSELAFTAYFSVFDIANMIGHLLRVIAFYLIYEALIEISLNQPYEVLFRDLKQSRDVLYYTSTHDVLTGLYNRRYFEDEMRRLDEQGPFPVSILVMDVNDLKIINDQHGHEAGDQALKEVANALRNTFRSNDLIARIGGDEFAVLLPNNDLAAVQEAVRRLDHYFTDHYKGDNIPPVAVGMAVASHPGTLLSANRLADEDMYANKATQKSIQSNSRSLHEMI